MGDTPEGKKPSLDRRGFVKSTLLCGGAVLLTGIPLTSFFLAPAMRKGTGKWVDFGPAKDLNPGKTDMLTYEFMVKDGWKVLPQRGFVWAKSGDDQDLKVFSSICTHLGCHVIWKEEKQIFQCPCHSGKFDANGQPISGPPKRPLSVLEHKIEEDKLMVYLAF